MGGTVSRKTRRRHSLASFAAREIAVARACEPEGRERKKRIVSGKRAGIAFNARIVTFETLISHRAVIITSRPLRRLKDDLCAPRCLARPYVRAGDREKSRSNRITCRALAAAPGREHLNKSVNLPEATLNGVTHAAPTRSRICGYSHAVSEADL